MANQHEIKIVPFSNHRKEVEAKNTIKAIVTNLDGVITGDQYGINFPIPHQKELDALLHLQSQRVPVIFCTAKYNYPVRKIINLTQLDNPHITDAGALIINPMSEEVLVEHDIDQQFAADIVNNLARTSSYIELYTADKYFIQANKDQELIRKRVALLEQYPILVDSLTTIAEAEKIIKIEPIVTAKEKIEEVLAPFRDNISFSWTNNPTMPLYHEGIITGKDVSKRHAVLELAQSIDISPDDFLGVGYSAGHWDFMQECGYIGVIGGNPQLQTVAVSKGEGKYALGRSVNEHGFLDVLKYFGLLPKRLVSSVEV